jgi:hypothetical protein
MAHLKKSAATGHLLKHPTTGHLVLTCGNPACELCTTASRATPPTVRAAFDSLNDCGCVDLGCSGGGTCWSWEMLGTPGTYDLHQSDPADPNDAWVEDVGETRGPCVWVYRDTASALTGKFYERASVNPACNVTYLLQTSTDLRMYFNGTEFNAWIQFTAVSVLTLSRGQFFLAFDINGGAGICPNGTPETVDNHFDAAGFCPDITLGIFPARSDGTVDLTGIF